MAGGDDGSEYFGPCAAATLPQYGSRDNGTVAVLCGLSKLVGASIWVLLVAGIATVVCVAVTVLVLSAIAFVLVIPMLFIVAGCVCVGTVVR